MWAKGALIISLEIFGILTEHSFPLCGPLCVLTNVGSFQNVVLALHFKWGTFLRDVRFQPESTFCKSDQIEGHHLIPCGFEKILGIQNFFG